MKNKQKLYSNILNRRKLAFTLAEILITLGIIGIVAAITIPILSKNIKDTQYKTAYKKAYSVAQQALTFANNENLLTPLNGEGGSAHLENFYVFMNQFKVFKKCISNDNSKCWDNSGEKYFLSGSIGYPQEPSPAFIDASGNAWSMYYSFASTILLDTNGFKKPNQWGKDRFALRFVDAKNNYQLNIPAKIVSLTDNHPFVCTQTKCETELNYFGVSWLYK